jgi:hypothetical protein
VQGNPGPLVSTLPSGDTETGYVSLASTATAANAFARTSISFQFPLATAPAAYYVTGGPTAQCPGSFAAPSAVSGNLCVYQNPAGSLNGSAVNVEGPSGDGTSTRFGTGLFERSAGAGDFAVSASWAVTG